MIINNLLAPKHQYSSKTSTVLYLQRKQAIVICRTTNTIKLAKFHAISLICLVVFFRPLKNTHQLFTKFTVSALFITENTACVHTVLKYNTESSSREYTTRFYKISL